MNTHGILLGGGVGSGRIHCECTWYPFGDWGLGWVGQGLGLGLGGYIVNGTGILLGLGLGDGLGWGAHKCIYTYIHLLYLNYIYDASLYHMYVSCIHISSKIYVELC